MRVLFLHPETESLGVEYLTAALRQAGHTVSLIIDPVLFDGTMSRYKYSSDLAKLYSQRESILEQIDERAPDLIAFSVLTNFYQWAKTWAADIKKRKPDVPIIFGGIHPTSVPEVVLRDLNVNYVCVGEGEAAIVDLANMLERKEGVVPIPNIWYRDPDGGLVRSEVRKLEADLDKLPFPDKDLFYEYFRGYIGYSLMTGRGCLFRCSFCSHSIFAKLYEGKGRLLRRRSVENVMAELRLAESRYNKPFYIFDDDIFTYDIAWLESFSKQYAAEINKPTFVWVEPSTLTPAIVDVLVRMRCFAVEMGVQNINEEYRKRVMHRNNTNQQIKNAINWLRKSGIEVIVDNMVGCPGETVDDIKQLIEFYNENRPSRFFVFFLRYFPRVDIIQHAGLSQQQIDLFEDGKSIKPFLLPADEGNSGEKMQLLNLLLYVQLLPRWLVSYMLKEKIYRFLPARSIMQFELFFFGIFSVRQILKGRNPLWYMRPATTLRASSVARKAARKKPVPVKPLI
ncbi:MAG: B12-binding domain-containing radical SAM protein [Candidatus Omnitrophica bacterium]|nr:B12-binding domain-containing radical SAM protein [Candidatus Omnitrophota bacterium]